MKRTQGMFAVLVLGSTLAGAGAYAAPPHSATAAQVREVRDAKWDLKRLERLQDRFANARARNDRAAMRQVEDELQKYLQAELREARADVRGAGTRAQVREESRALQRIRAIDRELDRLYRRFDRSSVTRKSDLISDLVRQARIEVADARSDHRDSRRR